MEKSDESKGAPMESIAFRLPVDELNILLKVQSELGITVSELIRTIIREYLEIDIS